jgi:hypothetical protein
MYPRILRVSFHMFHSHLSRNPLALLVIWSWLLGFSLVYCLLQYSTYVDLIYIYIHIFCVLHLHIFVHILYLYADLYLYHGSWIFLCIYSTYVDQLDLPHHKHQVSTPVMSHSLLTWPFRDFLLQLLYEIFFQHLLFFMLTNKCN